MDFLTSILKSLSDAWTGLEQSLAGSPVLAGVGVILAAGVGVIALIVLIVWTIRALFAMRRSSLAAKIRRDD